MNPVREAVLSLHSGRLAHGLLRELFIVETFEDRQQLCHLEQVFGSLRQLQEFYIATATPYRRIAGNQLAKARTVDMADITKIEYELETAFIDSLPHRCP
jgi:hypothetical protein